MNLRARHRTIASLKSGCAPLRALAARPAQGARVATGSASTLNTGSTSAGVVHRPNQIRHEDAPGLFVGLLHRMAECLPCPHQKIQVIFPTADLLELRSTRNRHFLFSTFRYSNNRVLPTPCGFGSGESENARDGNKRGDCRNPPRPWAVGHGLAERTSPSDAVKARATGRQASDDCELPKLLLSACRSMDDAEALGIRIAQEQVSQTVRPNRRLRFDREALPAKVATP